MMDALGYDFMRQAVLAGLLASVACGLVGTLVVVNRIVFISGGLAHGAYGGLGLALFLGLPPVLGAVGFSLALALMMALLTFRHRQRADTVIGVLWAVGMALGVILIDLTPGYNVDLMSYLFGSILAVSNLDLWLIAGLDAAVVSLVALVYNGFLAMSYDQEFAATRGVPVRALHLSLLVMVALAVVLVIRVVGLLLVIALLTIPPSIAEEHCRSLKAMMVLSVALCALFCLAGLALSYWLNLTTGPSIIMVAAAFFLASLVQRRLKPRPN
ncbi:MAG: metal ABC transporter permease [Deltaproteobacteria bacterium]|nr:metal ABC transporter permease [Deltaproteobacteria bacterium]